VAEADAHDAIRHVTKSWRSSSKWHAGFGDTIGLHYTSAGADADRLLVMELEDARAHVGVRYTANLHNLCVVVHEGNCIAFVQKNIGRNVLTKKALAEQDGYACVVCSASSRDEAAHFAEDMRHLVTEANLEDVSKRKHSATFHAAAGALADGDDVVYGLGEDANAGLVDSRALWYRGAVSHRQSQQLKTAPDVHTGDFYIRESSASGKFTLTVMVDEDDGAVAHFRIMTVDLDDNTKCQCYLEGHENIKFRSLTELVDFYDSKGLGEVNGRKVKLIRAMGYPGLGSVMELKLAKMNALIKRGFNF